MLWMIIPEYMFDIKQESLVTIYAVLLCFIEFVSKFLNALAFGDCIISVIL